MGSMFSFASGNSQGSFSGGEVPNPILVPAGTAALPSYAFSGAPGDGMFSSVATARLAWSIGGVDRLALTMSGGQPILSLGVNNSPGWQRETGLHMQSNEFLAWTPGANQASSLADLRMYRDDIATLALRNGAEPHELRIYKENAAADEFVSFGWRNNADVLTVETEEVGGGTVRNMALMGGKVGINKTNLLSTFTVVPFGAEGILLRQPNDLQDAVRIYATNSGGSITVMIGSAVSTSISTAGASVHNEMGHSARDFRFEGAGDTHLLMVDAGEAAVGIGYDSTEMLATLGKLLVDGALGVNTPQPQGQFSVASPVEGTASLNLQIAREVHTLANAATSDTSFSPSIPSGVRPKAVGFNVDVDVVDDGGDNTWSAAFITGSTTILVTGAAAAQDTKINFMIPDEITSGVLEIRFTANGGNFTAGEIEVLVWYEDQTSLANV